jgi:hypothetical protein
MTTESKETLVMGAAIGFNESQIAPFLISLRKAGYQGDVALLVDPACVRQFSASPIFSGVRLIKAAQWIPYRFDLIKKRPHLMKHWRRFQSVLWVLMRAVQKLPLPTALKQGLRMRIGNLVFPPSEARYFRYYRFLLSHEYTRVLITDVRDVLFQQDPFLQLPIKGLAVSMEDRRLLLADETHNSNWVRLAYGQKMLDGIGHNRISCSGVSYGDISSMRRYLQLMCEEMLGLSRYAINTGIGGTDQGIHNTLLWTGRLGDCTFLETLEGPVATLCGVPESQLQMNEDGRLLNRDGSVISVVHQYDRFPSLSAALLRSIA